MLSTAKSVTCPICSKHVFSRRINEHIDSGCQKHIVEGHPQNSVVKAVQSSSKHSQSDRLPPSSPLAPVFNQSLKRSHSAVQSSDSQHPVEDYESGANEKISARPMASNKRSRHTYLQKAAPLAEKMRPQSLSEYIGQHHLTGPDSLLMQTIVSVGSASSVIFWGPPGCGKTTLARLVAGHSDSIFKELSATSVGTNEVKVILEEAKRTLSLTGRKTTLFLDEMHRFNKAQQDVFLPFVEQGHIQLVGATTENPSFKLNGALLSRCRVFVLERLTDEEIRTIIVNAIKRVELTTLSVTDSQVEQPPTPPGSSQPTETEDFDVASSPFPQLTEKVLQTISSLANGDARVALSLLELVIKAPQDSSQNLLLKTLRRSVSASYDRTGDSHYDMISALHKSVRGSDGSAAMYWLARMLVAGEDPLYIARRMVVCASEDIGLADAQALPLAVAALHACQNIGMPECRINLAHVVAYLAEAPKSTRAYEAYQRAEAAAKLDTTIPVPMQVRNAPTKLMKELGFGEEYRYNPAYAHPVHNPYLPIQFAGERFLKAAGDDSERTWDEGALLRWEQEVNGGKAWEGRGRDTIMPVTPRNSQTSRQQGAGRNPLRVLLTGFGPFAQYTVNPSWLAAAPLHNKILHPEPLSNDADSPGSTPFTPRPIHVSALEIPVLYEAVSEIVPKLHARPPVVPSNVPEDFPPPPPSGYDFMFHIGAAGRGPLRMERQGHKFGYQMKDAKGNYAPLVRPPKDFAHGPDEPSAAEIMERDRLGLEIAESTADTTTRPTRGFGPGYEICPEEITTDVDVTRLVHDLRRSGIEQIYSSMDAGHYLCDYIYYCSLAEARRLAKPYDKRKSSQVLFLHCPPVSQPLSTEEVTDAIKRIIVWVCREIQIEDESDATVDVVSVAPARK